MKLNTSTTIVLGNLGGSLFFAAILVKYTGLVTAPIETFITNAANTRGALPWHELFLRGIGCNIMVRLELWTSSS
jgi:formate/nitrite transporter FocA (FNT family)